jgi:hypothetical protein
MLQLSSVFGVLFLAGGSAGAGPISERDDDAGFSGEEGKRRVRAVGGDRKKGAARADCASHV